MPEPLRRHATARITCPTHPRDTLSGVHISVKVRGRNPGWLLRKGIVAAVFTLTCFSATPLQVAAVVKPEHSSETAPSNSRCKAKDAGKTRSNGSLVCIRSASTYFWSKVFSQNDVIQFADFCSKYLTAGLCGGLERTAYRWIDSRARGADQCVRLLRQWVYQIKTDLDSGVLSTISHYEKFGGASYYESKLIPVARTFPGCWEPNR